MTLYALLGAKALYLLYAWLASAIVASYLSELFVPARADSRWKLQGMFGSGGKTVAEARAERDVTEPGG